MNNMNSFLLILGLAASPAFGLYYNKNLTVRYDYDPSTVGITSYMPMPTSVSEARDKGWEKMENPKLAEGYESLDVWCPAGDYTICMLYDDTEYIAGLQIAINRDTFKDASFDWATSGFSEWTVTNTEVTINYYVIHQYYISTESLKTSPEDRIKARDDERLLQEDIYLEGFYGDLYTVPTSVNDLKNSSLSRFTEQNCMDGMGTHYYYNMTTELQCSAETILLWFVLESNGQIVAIGFTLAGVYTKEEGKIYPFENPDRSITEYNVPRAPECLYDYADSPGLITMHTYFVDEANLIKCP